MRRYQILGLCFAALLLSAVNVSARALVQGPVTIQATTENASASWTLNFDQYVDENDQWAYSINDPIDLVSNGNVLGSISALSLDVKGDPVVDLGFTVMAGNEDTQFTIISTVLNFDPIPNAVGYATAGMTLTSNRNASSSMTGAFDGKCYRAIYNGDKVFANLVDSFSAPPRGSNASDERYPLQESTWATLSDTPISMQSVFSFKLTPWKLASGTSTFEVQAVPEPGSLTLAICAVPALVCFARRRRK